MKGRCTLYIELSNFIYTNPNILKLILVNLSSNQCWVILKTYFKDYQIHSSNNSLFFRKTEIYMFFLKDYNFGHKCICASFTFGRTGRQIDAKHLTRGISGLGRRTWSNGRRERGVRGEERTTGRRCRLFLWATKNSFELRPLQQKHTNTAICVFRIFCCLRPVAMRKKGHLLRRLLRWQDDWRSTGSVVRTFRGSEVFVGPLLCIAYGLTRRVDIFIPNS